MHLRYYSASHLDSSPTFILIVEATAEIKFSCQNRTEVETLLPVHRADKMNKRLSFSLTPTFILTLILIMILISLRTRTLFHSDSPPIGLRRHCPLPLLLRVILNLISILIRAVRLGRVLFSIPPLSSILSFIPLFILVPTLGSLHTEYHSSFHLHSGSASPPLTIILIPIPVSTLIPAPSSSF